MNPIRRGFSFAKNFAALLTLVALLVAPLILFDVERPEEPFNTPEARAQTTISKHLETPVRLIQSVHLEAGGQVLIPIGKTGGTGASQNQQSLVFTGATITIDMSPHVRKSKAATALREALSNLDDNGQPIPDITGFRQFNVQRLTIQVRRPGGAIHFIGRFDGRVAVDDKKIQLAGTISRNNISSEIEATLAPDGDADRQYTAELNVSGPVLALTMNGALTTEDKLSLRADRTTLKTENMTRLMSWLGMGQDGNGIGTFESTSSFDWTNTTIALDHGTFAIDGNDAEGRVSFHLDPKEPSIDATLAFATLDLSPYIAKSDTVSSLSRDIMLRTWRALHRSIFTQAPANKFENIDADLRLSAQSVTLFDKPVGAGAAVVLLKDGKLQADFADITLADGGNGNVQFEADVTGYLPGFDIRGTFESVDLGRLSNKWFGSTVLDGTGQLSLELDAEGNTWDQILKTLSGDIALRTNQGARIGLDLASMFAKPNALPSDGWGAFADASNSVDALTLSLKAARGSVTTKVVRARRGETVIAAKGTIRLTDLLLDMVLTRVAVSAGDDEPASGNGPLTGNETLQLRGPLFKPVIRAISAANSRNG